MKRHNLRKRVADKVKISRAIINKDTIDEFFNNISEELEGVPPERLFNIDETHFTDDPGQKSVIVKKGHSRRVERKQEHSKQSISVMFCGNAAGHYLPPMVIYKAQNLYTGWTQGCPARSLYSVSKNGWFDGEIFRSGFSTYSCQRHKK